MLLLDSHVQQAEEATALMQPWCSLAKLFMIKNIYLHYTIISTSFFTLQNRSAHFVRHTKGVMPIFLPCLLSLLQKSEVYW